MFPVQLITSRIAIHTLLKVLTIQTSFHLKQNPSEDYSQFTRVRPRLVNREQKRNKGFLLPRTFEWVLVRFCISSIILYQVHISRHPSTDPVLRTFLLNLTTEISNNAEIV